MGRPKIAESFLSEFSKEYPQYALESVKVDLDNPLEIDYDKSHRGIELFRKCQILRAKQIPLDQWPMSVQAFYNAWRKWKCERGLSDFTDLIEHCLLLKVYPESSPSIGFFDEAQDFTPLELALVRMWGKQMDQIILAADDDQMLYHFKGATAESILNPPLPEQYIRVLSQSYRVPRKVHAFAEQLVKNISVRQQKTYYPRDHEGCVESLHNVTMKNPSKLIERSIEAFENNQSIMILASCAYMLVPLISELKKLGIPFHNPYRQNRGDWNPLSKRKGVTITDRILSLLRPHESVWKEYARMWMGNELKDWVKPIDAKFIKVKKKEIEKVEDDEKMEISQLVNLIGEAGMNALMDNENTALQWYENSLTTSWKSKMAFPFRCIKRFGSERLNYFYNRNGKASIIGTIHSVKGGEADKVYVFPDLSPSGMREMTTNKDSIIRMFYVACTRARESLFLCDPANDRHYRFSKR